MGNFVCLLNKCHCLGYSLLFYMELIACQSFVGGLGAFSKKKNCTKLTLISLWQHDLKSKKSNVMWDLDIL